MYLWFLLWLGTVVESSSHWEPCKVQCDSNFRRNDLSQQALVPVCQRGCDLFNVAFVSASKSLHQELSVVDSGHNNIIARPLQATEFHTAIHTRVIPVRESSKESKKKNNEISSVKTSPSPKSSPSTKKHQAEPSANKTGTATHSKFQKHDTSTSKTTVEPTSQPVQDHPVEASKQTTTPNGPRRETAKTGKNEEKVIEVKQTNADKHIAKHAPKPMQKAEMKIVPLGNKHPASSIQDQHPKKENEDLKGRLEQAKHSCRQECMAAYVWPSEQEACVVGCNLQATTASLKPATDIAAEVEAQTSSPFGMFQRVVFNLAGHVGRLIRISWSWASSSHARTSPEKLQVYGSEGLTRHAQMPLFMGLRPAFVQEQTQKRMETIEAIREEQNNAIKLLNEEFFPNKVHPFDISITAARSQNAPKIITILKQESTTHHKDRDHHSHSNNQNQGASKQEKKHHHDDHFAKLEEELNLDNLDIASLHPISSGGHRRDNVDQQIQHQLDLLECISRKSGLPRWFIAITIFTSAIVVLWLCFSLTAPPDDIKVVKTKPPELETLVDEDDELDDDDLSCSEKKKLLARADDIIKIRIENV